MDLFNLQPSPPVGVLKETIKNAILDGVIPNDREAAYHFLLEKAKGLGFSPLRVWNYNTLYLQKKPAYFYQFTPAFQ